MSNSYIEYALDPATQIGPVVDLQQLDTNLSFKRNAEAGIVKVNQATSGLDYHLPFGARKGSSYGPRGQGRYAAEFYAVVKAAYTSGGC